MALGWDGACYYAYLPALVVHRDLSFSYTEKITNPESKKMVAYVITEDGKRLPKTTCGVSIMYLPFYMIAHGTNYLINGSGMDGYEPVYLFCICMGAILYAISGILILRKMLRIFFDDWITALALTGIFWGTNLYFYVVREPFMSHIYSFFLITVLVYWSYKWAHTFKCHQVILLAMVVGVITLIRPTNVIFGIIPLFINITSWQTAKNRLKLLLKHYHLVLIGLLVFSIIIFIQLVLWKIGTGDWLRLSYGNERFFWNHPRIMDGLLSYRKGWLVYSPIMVFSVAGLFFMHRKLRSFSFFIRVVLLLNIYIVFCWWCWWYGGSYGMRALIDSYPLWIFCFASFLEKLSEFKIKIPLYLTIGIIGYFVSSNIHNTRQYRIGHIHHDSMTREAFWAGYWKEAPAAGYDLLLRAPDYEAAKLGIDEYHVR